MALTSFAVVRPWGRAIKTRVTRREMSPWSAHSRWDHYLNDTSLTQRQIETIAASVDAGLPEGEGSGQHCRPMADRGSSMTARRT